MTQAIDAGDVKAGGLLLAAFQAGQVEDIEWVEVTVGDLVVTVASDALKAPVGDRKGVRLPVSYEEAILICKGLECLSPTQAICDAMYASAKAKLLAVTLPPTVQMNSLAWTLRFNDGVEAELAKAGAAPGNLAFGAWKLWILHPRIVEKGAVNYGFWDAHGHPIQTVGGQHNDKHYDYSQVLQPVQRWARSVGTGEPVDLAARLVERDHIPAPYIEVYKTPEPPASFAEPDAPVDLLQTLSDSGVNVEPADGWQRHGRPGLMPEGIMVHHTAGPTSGDAPSLSVCINGRPGLSGPLCHILLARNGTAHLIAAGIANHAGQGASEVLDRVRAGQPVEGDAKDHGYHDAVFGNTYFYGIEVENSGKQGDAYPDAQIDALVKICAALCSANGWTADRIVHHRQWTMRKIDMSYCEDLVGAVRDAMTPAADAPVATS